jgi:hypothetical protein
MDDLSDFSDMLTVIVFGVMIVTASLGWAVSYLWHVSNHR